MRKHRMWRALAATACGAAMAAGAAAQERKVTAADLSAMSLEDLGKLEISSVSKRPERLADAAASVFVITREDIRRSGYITLPDLLRLAPNLHVARVDAGQYAISARGHNGTAANKLLVLIDGRSVYTPLFSGVFWDVPDTLAEDIERIEVISGPGGTLWGANAVNGIINVITRSARDSTGGLVSVAAGDKESVGGARWGGRWGDDAHFRVYGKGFRRDDTVRASGASARDDIRKGQVGFRIDGGAAGNGYTLQGDAYDGSIDQPANARKQLSGGNLLARWNRKLADGSDLQVQAYWDHSRRDHPGVFAESLDTFDLEVHHGFAWRRDHQVLWGGGLRRSTDRVTNTPVLAFLPAKKALHLGNVFVQDTIALDEALRLTLGAKVEHNNYTGWEFQPNARMAWEASDKSLLWSALSRAVRTPSRVDRELFAPGSAPFTQLQGGPGFVSEKLTAFELGWRSQPLPQLSYSVTAFWHKYDDLRSLERVDPLAAAPTFIANMMEGHTRGLEAWGSWRAADWWRLSAGFNLLKQHLRLKPGSTDARGPAGAGNDPEHKFVLRSSMNFGPRMELDANVRAVGSLPNPAVPSYVALDLRWGWQVSQQLELSLAGQNLTDRGRPEFGAVATRGEVPRSLLVKLVWKL